MKVKRACRANQVDMIGNWGKAAVMHPETATAPIPAVPIQRSHGRGCVTVRHAQRGTVLADLYQHANAKIRIPKTYEPSLQAVLVNTAGGIAGGDTLEWKAIVAPGASAIVTTQACERIYGHATQNAVLTNAVDVRAGGHCAWLPQETIIYQGAMVERSLSVDLAADASFIGLETIVLGRALMGEVLSSFHLRDQWRVCRNGVPLFSDIVRLDGHSAALASRAGLNGKTVMATLLYVPPSDGEPTASMRERIHALGPRDDVHIGVSAFDTHLVCRVLAPSSYALRLALDPLLSALSAHVRLPQIWRF